VLVAALVGLVSGCGGRGDGRAIFTRAQDGLMRVRSATIELHATLHALVPIERSARVRIADLPLSRLHLARWARHPRRLACGSGLDCAGADLDIEAALHDLDPLLPSLPFDPASIRSARVEVAVGSTDGIPRRLRLQGRLDAGGLVPGSVPLDVDVSLKHPRAG
jgi:hypothetical protein